MLTVGEYLNDDFRGMTADMIFNAENLINRVNLLESHYYQENPEAPRLTLASGRRLPETNARTPGASPTSWHLKCAAIDRGEARSVRPFARWCVANLHLLADPLINLYMEDPRTTIGQWTSWVHLQIFPPKSGVRVFIPTADWAARLKGDPLSPGDIKA